MKKLVFVLAVFAFASCGGGESTDSKTDSMVEEKKEMIDSSASATKDMVDSSAEAKKDMLDSSSKMMTDTANKR